MTFCILGAVYLFISFLLLIRILFPELETRAQGATN